MEYPPGPGTSDRMPKAIYQHGPSFQVKDVPNQQSQLLQIPIMGYIVYKYKGFSLALDVSYKTGWNFSG